MNKYIFLVGILLVCIYFGNVQEGLMEKGPYEVRRYIPIPHYATGPFMHLTSQLSPSAYMGHNEQLGY